MSETYGIANEATAIAVRVLDKNEITTTMRAVQGLEWAIKHHDQRPENVKKSIINLSISTSRQSHAINDLVTKATDKNIYVVSAAGNIDRSKDEQCKDACSSSPGSARTSITVMASDEDEKFASFNKYGDCAHIIAPGHNIVSTYIGSNRRATYTLSGTSVAAPHVSGVIAKYISSLSVLPTPIKLRDELVFNATKDIIVDLPADMEHSAVIYYPAPKICSP